MMVMTRRKKMEADNMWFKSNGVVVLENCSLNREIYERPTDYKYDKVLIDFKNRRVFMYTGKDVLFFQSEIKLPCADLIVSEFVKLQLSMKSSLNIYQILELLIDTFGRSTKTMTEIAIMEIQAHREHMYAEKIQECWRRCVSDPGYKVCRDRLEREFSEFVQVV